MDDTRLQSLYRRLSAERQTPPSADDLAEALSRSGYPDEEGTTLDRILASPAHADLLRTALQLSPEATALSRELSALRAAPARRAPARGWMALAAAVGTAAILVATLREAPQAPMPAPSIVEQSSDAILSVSFEGTPSVATPAGDAEPIFRTDFNS